MLLFIMMLMISIKVDIHSAVVTMLCLNKQSSHCLRTNTGVDIFDKYHVQDIIFYPSTTFLQPLFHIIHFTVFPGCPALTIVIIVVVVVSWYRLATLGIVIFITTNCDTYVFRIVARHFLAILFLLSSFSIHFPFFFVQCIEIFLLQFKEIFLMPIPVAENTIQTKLTYGEKQVKLGATYIS